MMSPVWFFMCHEKGRRSIWEKSESRMFFTSVSEPFVLLTRKRYCDPTRKSATNTTAHAIIHMCFPRYSKPPKRATISMTAGE